MKLTLSAFAFALALISAVGTAAAQSKTSAVGHDVSWPECRASLPGGGRFAVVGVNGGIPERNNPCFHREFQWAKDLRGVPGRHPADIYVNTSNHGPAEGAWPRSNRDPFTRRASDNPFGVCRGRDTGACAWQFGWNSAESDVRYRGPRHPAKFLWWLDVETENWWESNRANNRAVLNGMVTYFRGQSIPVGVYSTALQWNEIAGSVPPGSPLTSLPEWLTGASDLAEARTNCAAAPFIRKSVVLLSQWFSSGAGYDGDVACPLPSGYERVGIQAPSPVSRGSSVDLLGAVDLAV